MKQVRRLFDFYLDASVHVALSVVSLVGVTSILLNITVNNHLVWFLFFGTIVCYNFVKYGVEAKKYVLLANRYHKNIQVFSFVAAAAMLYHAYFLSLNVLYFVTLLAVISGTYALPVLPKAKNLRSLGALKMFVVALVWMGATVLLPVLSAPYNFWWDMGIEAFQRFLLVLILLVPFEIRDLAYDSVQLKTLPQRYGVTNTKLFGAFMVLLLFFSTFLKDEIALLDLCVKGILFLVLGSLMFITKRKQPNYFASFWVEAIPIIWFMVIWLLEVE